MSTPGRWWQSTIRVRLTLLYAGAFFLAGTMLVALMYFFMGQALDQQVTLRVGIAEEYLQTADSIQADTSQADTSRSVIRIQDGMLAQFQQDRDNTLNTMLIVSLILLGVVGLIGGGFGWFLAGQVLHPLQQITMTARRIADRNLHERIDLIGPNDEIKDLADTLDAMLERLDRSFDSQRRFVANASHELRTPLTINRTLIEVALENPQVNESLRQLGATLLAVNQRHERLINGLLTLADSEQRVVNPIPVDLADIARHITTESQSIAQTANVTLDMHLQFAPVAGDPILLERLVYNLVDNAIRYNLPEKGKVTIITSVVDHHACLSVENTGQPIPAYEIPGLFEPFRRLSTTERLADTTNSSLGRGAGLGLSIVRSIARVHGGDVHALPRENGGLILKVRLPAVSEKSIEEGTGEA